MWKLAQTKPLSSPSVRLVRLGYVCLYTRLFCDNGKQEVKYFWAFPIFDYASKEVKILDLTQKSIIQTITDYSNNTDWGNPVMKYSFSVKKSGTGFDTEYTVMANPAGTLPEGVETAWKDKKEEVTKTISEMFSVAEKTDTVACPESNVDEIPF